MTKKQIKAELEKLVRKWRNEVRRFSEASLDPIHAHKDRARYEGEGIALGWCARDVRDLIDRL